MPGLQLLTLPDSCLELIVLHADKSTLLSLFQASRATRQLVLQHVARVQFRFSDSKPSKNQPHAADGNINELLNLLHRAKLGLHLKLSLSRGDG